MPSLTSVNLITGKNNTGKTALLEAIYLCCASFDNESRFHQLFRSAAEQIGVKDFGEWLFYNQENGADASIRVDLLDGQNCSVYLKHGSRPRSGLDAKLAQFGDVHLFVARKQGKPGVPNSVPEFQIISFSTHPSQPTSDAIDYINAAKRSGGEERMETLLREIEPRLRKVRAFQVGGSSHSLIYADIGLRDLIPVTQLGQGFNRLLKIYSSILTSSSHICLIDEIENGLHHSVLPEVWKGLDALALQENVQIFATTHSWECVIAAHEVFRRQEPYGFALHRLERVNGEIQAMTYDRETLDAVDELEMEVR